MGWEVKEQNNCCNTMLMRFYKTCYETEKNTTF